MPLPQPYGLLYGILSSPVITGVASFTYKILKEKETMKKFFSLVLALVMALSLTTMAWGAVADTDEAKIGDVGYATLELAVQAATADPAAQTIVMLKNVAIEAFILLDGDTLDGNGNTLDATALGGLDDSIKSAPGADDKSAIKTTGGTIKNLTIKGGWKGILILETADQDVLVDNVTIVESARGLCFTKNGSTWSDADLTVKNSTIAGWNSFATNGDVIFENTTFVVNESGRGNGLNPRNDMSLTNCVIEEGFEMNFEDLDASDNVSFVDCVYDGEPLTEDNFADFADDTYYDAAVHTVAVAATPGAKVAFHAADGSADGWALLDIFVGADLDDFAKDASDKCLPCYEVNGDYYVEVKAASASYKLVYGAKTVYLTPVAAKLVKYVDTASVLNVVDKDDAECGDYYVTNLDEDDVYYISYNKKGDAVDGIWVAAKNGSVQILVNGKIVDAEDASSDVTFMFHKFKGYDAVNYQYTTVKCTECGKVANLYANSTAAGKKAVKIDNLGWVTYADYMGFGASASAGTTTGKVESAETFDAGIAMYVGMSVMAAAGSAVVIGKKKD